MSKEGSPGVDTRRVVLRENSAYWITGLAAAVFLFFTIDAVAQGAIGFALESLPWMLLVLWIIYVLLLRTCIVLTPGKLEVVNVLRRHVISWSAVEHVGSRYQLVIYLNDGRRVVSWGAPASGLDRPRRRPTSRYSNRLGIPAPAPRRTPPTQQIVETIMNDWPQSPTPDVPDVVSGWDWVAIVTTLAIVALCVIDRLVISGAQ